jgi:hypothetical protein
MDRSVGRGVGDDAQIEFGANHARSAGADSPHPRREFSGAIRHREREPVRADLVTRQGDATGRRRQARRGSATARGGRGRASSAVGRSAGRAGPSARWGARGDGRSGMPGRPPGRRERGAGSPPRVGRSRPGWNALVRPPPDSSSRDSSKTRSGTGTGRANRPIPERAGSVGPGPPRRAGRSTIARSARGRGGPDPRGRDGSTRPRPPRSGTGRRRGCRRPATRARRSGRASTDADASDRVPWTPPRKDPEPSEPIPPVIVGPPGNLVNRNRAVCVPILPITTANAPGGFAPTLGESLGGPPGPPVAIPSRPAPPVEERDGRIARGRSGSHSPPHPARCRAAAVHPGAPSPTRSAIVSPQPRYRAEIR